MKDTATNIPIFCYDCFEDLLASIPFAKKFSFLAGLVSKIFVLQDVLQSKNQFLRNAFGRSYFITSLIITIAHFKSNLSLYSQYYAEAFDEFWGPISASLRPGNTAPFKEMWQRWQVIGNTVSDFTSPRFKPQTSRSRDERVTA